MKNIDVQFNFSNMRFVVTGASTGIGRQLSIDLMEAGAMVLGIARRDKLLGQLEAAYPQQFVPAICDVRDKMQLAIAIESFVQKHGKIHGSVHAAGVSEATSIRSMIEETNADIMDINFWGGMNLLNSATKKALSLDGASHVLIASIRAHKGEKGQYVYSASKAAALVASQSIAKEIAKRKQRINTVSPGWVESDMTRFLPEIIDTDWIKARHLLGIGQADDVTGAIMFLLSSKSSWITGTDIVIDGGYLLS